MRDSVQEREIRHETFTGKKVKLIDAQEGKVSNDVFYLLPDALVSRAVSTLYAETMTNPEAPYYVSRTQDDSGR